MSKKLGLVNSLQIASNIAVFSGLIAVGFQMSQDRQLSQAQLISDGRISLVEREMAVFGENPAPTIVKSISSPGNLSDDEILIAHSYLFAAIVHEQRQFNLIANGVYEDLFGNYQLPSYWVNFYFGNSFAKNWFAATLEEGYWLGEFERVLVEAIEQAPGNASIEFLSVLERGI
jgi:hypothetical protein